MYLKLLFACLTLGVTNPLPASAQLAAAPIWLSAEQLRPLAEACMKQIADAAKDRHGTFGLESYIVTETDRVRWGGLAPGAYESISTRGLPMASASSLDNGTPGAAWKACLDAKVRALQGQR